MIQAMIQTYSGKKFGNRVADFLGIHRGLFHSAMEEGGCEMHLLKLHMLKKQGIEIPEVALHASDFLMPGLLAIETRFGRQTLIDDAMRRIRDFTESHQSEMQRSTEPEDDVIVSSEFPSGRYQLSYTVYVKERIRGEERKIGTKYAMRSDNLDNLKTFAMMHKVGGDEVMIEDLESGEQIPYS